MLSVTIRQLEYVVAVAEHGGLSSAATAINVSQPSLSVAIARLETDLGKVLFIRRKGAAFVPTAFGLDFIESAQDLLAGVTLLVDPDATFPEQRRPITIGFFDDLAPLLLAPVLRFLERKHPDVLISTHVGGFERLSEGLDSGQFDFAMTYDLGLDETIERRQLALLPLHALVSNTHLFATRTSISLALLADEPLILADQGNSIRHMTNLLRRTGVTPRIAYRAASLEIMRSLVGNGFGTGLSYTQPAVHRSYDGKHLVSLKITDESTAEPIVLATNTLNAFTPLTHSIIDDVVAAAGLFRAQMD